VRAYATNAAGTAYGNEVSFTTNKAPTVTTQAVTNIGTTTATGNGNITDLGIPNPTQHGVVWDTSTGPTIADNKTEEGAASATGAFTSSMTGLSPGTTYYVRAYATNAAGTAYGNEVSFTTNKAPAVTTQAVTSIGTTTATGNGDIIDLGGPNPTAHGVVWNTTGNPTTADNSTNEGTANATGAFTSSMTGLSPGTTYYVRAYATNAAGTAYGNEVTLTAIYTVDRSKPIGGGNFHTIQAAIDAVPTGSTIIIADGVYNENVIVNNSVTLQAAGSGYTINGNFTVNAETFLLGNVTVSGTVYNNSTLNLTGGSLKASAVINASPTTIVVDGVIFTITTNKFTNNLRAQVHINGGGELVFAGASVELNNAGIINIGASAGPGSAGTGTLRPASAGGTVHLLNTGVINIGSSHIGSLGTAARPLGSLDNVGNAPVNETGTINISPRIANEIHVNGDWKSAGAFVAGGSTVTLSATGILEHNSINGFNNLTISGSKRTLKSNLVVNGDFAISAGAIFEAGSNDITVSGMTTPISGQMTATGGTQTYAGQGFTVNGVYNNGSNNVTVKITCPVTINGTATLGSGDVTVLNSITNTGTLTSTSGNLTVAGNLDNTNGEFYHNAGTVIFTDNGTITPNYSSNRPTVNVFNNVIKRGVGTSTTLPDSSGSPPDQMVVLGSLIIEEGRLEDVANGSTLIVEKDLLVSDNGALTLAHNASDLILRPPATTTQKFNPGVTSIYTDVFKRGLGKSQLETHPLTTRADLKVEAGRFNADEQNVTVGDELTIAQGAEMFMGNGTLKVTGATAVSGSLATDANADPEHTFAALTINPGCVYDNDEVEVIVTATGLVTNDGAIIIGVGTVSFAAGLTNNNTFTSTPGVLNVGGGNFTNSGQYDANEGTLILGKDVSDFSHGGSVYHNITKSGAGSTTTTSSGVGISRTLTIDGTLTVESGTFATDNSDVINIVPADSKKKDDGGAVINNGAAFTLADTSTLNVDGDFTNEGTFAGAAGATLHLIGSEFDPGDSDYAMLLKTSEKVTQVKDSTFKFTGATWTNYGQYIAKSDSTVELNGTNQTIFSIGAEGAYIAFENIKTNNSGTVTFSTDIQIGGTFTIAGGATVTDTVAAAIPGNVYTFTNKDAEVVVSGTWTLKGSSSLGRISLLGTDEMNKKGQRWTLILNSSGAVNIDEVNLRDSELITHGGSLNGKNVDYNVVSYGNLSPSWGPFDPVPVEPPPTEPAKPSLLGDANDDGVVNLADFSILAADFGTSDSKADFNGDGFVTLTDFSILAANFGKTANVSAAPVAMRKKSFRTPQDVAGRLSLRIPAKQLRRGDVVEVAVMAEDASLKAYSFILSYDASILRLMESGVSEGDFLKDAFFMAREDGRIFGATFANASEGTGVLTKLRFQVVADGVSENAIALRDVQVVDGAGRFSHLPELHAKLSTVPHKTRLLANYPNPFNPETWIPFELSDGAKVKIQIYDVSGRLIRTLDLGHRDAGHYLDRSTAAHWNGTNSTGERVASGVYLYRLTAGDFSAMRKILILK